jgi:hypothetical protein
MTKLKNKKVTFDDDAFLDELVAQNAALKAVQDRLDAEEAAKNEHAKMLLDRKIAREKVLQSARKIVSDPHLAYSSKPNIINKGIF